MNSSPLRDTLHIIQFIVILLLMLLAVFAAPRHFPSLSTPDRYTVLSGADEFGELLASPQASLADLRQGGDALDFQALNLPDDFTHLPLDKRNDQFIAEMGQAYIADIRFLIEHYDLESLENAAFDQSTAAMVIRFQRHKQAAMAAQSPSPQQPAAAEILRDNAVPAEPQS